LHEIDKENDPGRCHARSNLGSTEAVGWRT
jgi:hypothetical protein